MENNVKYKVVTYVNKSAKMFHCGIFQEEFTSGKSNNNHKITSVRGKAEWLLKNPVGSTAKQSIPSAFNYMILNSKDSDWEVTIQSEEISEKDAKQLKFDITNEYSNAGFKTTDPEGSSLKNGGGTNKAKNRCFRADNTTLPKLKRFCKKCTINLDIPEKTFNTVISGVYSRITKGEDMTHIQVYLSFIENTQ